MKNFFTSISIAIGMIGFISSLMQARAQVQEAWVQSYPASGSNSSTAVAVKTDGTFVYMLARVHQPGFDVDGLLVKYTSAGAVVWEQTYSSPSGSYDDPTDMAIDAAGNIYVVGFSDVFDTETISESFTLKYANDGTLLWAITYSHPNYERTRLTSVALDASGNMYATGYVRNSFPNVDFVTIKYNSTGVQQWVRLYDGTNNAYDAPCGIVIDATGNIYVGGESDSKLFFYNGLPLYMGRDFRLIKYDPNGNTIWSSRTGSFKDDIPTSMAVDGASNIYLTGSQNGPGDQDYLTVKYDANGTLQWSATYNGPADETDYAEAVAVNSAGEVYVTGSSRETNGMYNYRTVKYSAAGTTLWTRSHGGANEAHGEAIALDGLGNIYVTGKRITGIPYEFATLKYTSSGVLSWVIAYGGPNSDATPQAMAVYTPPVPSTLNKPVVYVVGTRFDFGAITGRYIVTIKYRQPYLISPSSSIQVSNYPNPFTGSTTIVYELKEESRVSLQVIDVITGRTVEAISLGKQGAGEQRYLYQPKSLAKGNYVYNLVTESGSGKSVQRSVMRIGE